MSGGSRPLTPVGGGAGRFNGLNGHTRSVSNGAGNSGDTSASLNQRHISSSSSTNSGSSSGPDGEPLLQQGGANWLSEYTDSIEKYHIQHEEERMTVEQSICEDLRAFENRLVEIITEHRPPTKRWRLLLCLAFLATIVGAIQWLTDPLTYQVSALESFWVHKFFTASCLLLIGLFFPLGIHRRICAPSIVRSRIQDVIGQFNMSCDEQGRLILMPHPNYFHHTSNGNH